MVDNAQRTDVFPGTVVSQFSRGDILPVDPDFRAVMESQDLISFIIGLDDRSIVYYYPVTTSPSIRKHFRDTFNQLRPGNYAPSRWDAVTTRLKRSIDNLKKNIDVRTCFKYKKHFFVTKQAFTFGQRTVAEGTNHVFQVGPVKMTLYMRHSARATTRDKLFNPDDQHFYTFRWLKADENYRIKEGVTYIICTVQRSFFAIHVVPKDMTLPFETADPTPLPKRVRPDWMYRRPVATPMIEQVTLEREDEHEPSCSHATLQKEAPLARNEAPSVQQPCLAGLPETEPAAASPDACIPPPVAESLPPPAVASMPSAGPLIHIIKNYFVPSIPVEKEIQVVYPPVVEWYQTLKATHYGSPTEGVVVYDTEESGEPEDLTLPTATQEALSAILEEAFTEAPLFNLPQTSCLFPELPPELVSETCGENLPGEQETVSGNPEPESLLNFDSMETEPPFGMESNFPDLLPHPFGMHG